MTSHDSINPDLSLNAHRQRHSARWMPTQRSLEAARQRKKALHTRGTQPQTPSASTSLCSPTSDAPALEFPASPTPMEPALDDEEFPNSIAVPVRSMRSTKRKSEVTSDMCLCLHHYGV
ncbi:hypothetical protein K438DRAFT_1822552 [Mycena galopus ATCC 62051]|nr:hypothetical protein K438DRAFT_1895111 [Mycena galopus ATCC 62051]KAF8199797.1 hypothetical protein K438DRAFT_1822552 [Mycena galopus ATCC 62051]